MKSGGLILWNAIFYLRIVQDLLANVKTPYERRFGEPFEGPIILFGAMVENHPTFSQGLHQFGKKVFRIIFLGFKADRGENLKRRCSESRSGRFGKVARIRYSSSKNKREKQMVAELSGRDDEFQVPIQGGTWRNSRRIGRVSTGRTDR